jgi:MSHA biogenesis protein MshJ
MKAWAKRWAERIDAMALRERAIVFVATGLVLVFVFYALLGNPTTAQLRSVARDLAKKQADMRVMQEQAQALLATKGENPEAAQQARIAELKQLIVAADAQLAERQASLVTPERIPQLLEQMLKRDRRLELVELKSLPAVEMFTDKDTAGNAPIAAAAQTAGGRAAGMKVFRHGVELTVRGGYFELARYLGDLEHLPYRMFWKDVDLAATDYPRITMKLTVYTLSLERNWLVV